MTIELMPDSELKSPEDLLAEAKALSNLSIEVPPPQGKKTPNLDIPQSEGVSLRGLSGLLMGAIILVVISTAGGYFWGKNSVVQSGVANSEASPTIQPSPQNRVTPAPSPSGPVAIGDEVELASGLTFVLERAWIDSAYSKSKAALPAETQVNIEVTFTNDQSQAMSYTPSQFSLRDSENLEYKPASTATKEYKPLVLGSLLPGGSIKGGVSFVVPKEEKTFRLIYEDAEVIFSISTEIDTSN